MATVKDITTMCKAGNVIEAYEIAKADFNAQPQNVWSQRKIGWALYYMLKKDIENKDNTAFCNHIEEVTNLDLLTITTDSLFFDTVLWVLAEFIKSIPIDNIQEIDKLFSLFNKYTFNPSKGYSYLLKSCLRFVAWEHLVDFFEWWNLNNLLPEDYEQVELDNKQKIMPLAEQAYIAYSKALLKLNDKEKNRDFLPKIEKLIEDHPEMMYPGYFCGKLMLAIGTEKGDALNAVMPLVRKKQSEFWIWQLLGEIYKADIETCLACLLRAVHSKAQEKFLGKVRMKIASIYISHNDYARAKYHIEQMIQCYMKEGWRLPYEVQNWTREPWMLNAAVDKSDSIDYKRITDTILLNGTNKSIAIVTFVDIVNKCVAIIYGEKKRTMVKFRNLNVKEGTLLNIYWTPVQKGGINIIKAELLKGKIINCTYIKQISGSVLKSANHSFAFVKAQNISCFIHPTKVERYKLKGGETVTVLAAHNYNRGKEEWSWTCISVINVEL